MVLLTRKEFAWSDPEMFTERGPEYFRRYASSSLDPRGITDRSRGVESARPPGFASAFFPAPRSGCQISRYEIGIAIVSNDTRRFANGSGIQDAGISLITFPGVSADLNPRTFWQLFE